MSRRLLIIHHADEQRLGRKRHLIHRMIPTWNEAGIEVKEVYGIRDAPVAEVAFLHVDVSVVPPAYVKFARRYPVVINGGNTDIRKSRLSLLRIDRNTDYSGPVIVKSSLNCAGDPEMVYFRHRSKLKRIFVRKSPRPAYPMRMERKADYQIYPSPREVPDVVWDCHDLIVEKFRAEQHDGSYYLREWYFFGDQSVECAEHSPDPIFTSGTRIENPITSAPPQLQDVRKQLGFDYGKFDYTIVDGKAVPFDFNKTVAMVNTESEDNQRLAHQLAQGLNVYFS